MGKLNFGISFLLLLIPGIMLAQHFEVHMDKPFYVGGDVMQFKIYDRGPSGVEPVLLYVELINSNHSTITKQILSMDLLGASGSIYLPVDLEQGVYLLQYCRVWDGRSGTSKKIKSGNSYVIVLNDLETGSEDSKLIHPEEQLVFDKPVLARVNRRTRVSLPLSVADQNASISGTVSVAIVQYVSPVPGLISDVYSESPTPFIVDEKIYKPRTTLVLEGKVVDPKKNTPLTEKYLSFYLPRLGLFKRFNSGNGNFKIELPGFNGLAQYQVLSLNPNRSIPVSVIPLQSDFPAMTGSFPPLPPLSSAILNYLKQNYKRRLINDLFHTQPSVITVSIDSIKSMIPDRQYLMKDFQQLNSVQDFIKEVMLDSRITSLINQKMSLRLRNRETNELYNWPAWYLMNGFFAGQENEILQMELHKIKSIELFHRNKTITEQLDSMMVYTGMFALQAEPVREQFEKYGILKYELQGFEDNRPWTHTPVEEKRTPDLRSLLYWSPSQRPDQTGKITLDFFTSDLKGLFEIKVVGLDASKKPLGKSWWIEVE
ncbi:MAG: hypothetical protein SH818_04000 [Saprospiraceae bacterium]|nr:hypothetical protein [Saprospiraceae bacterium]